jgi:sulfur-carrier protein
VAILRLFASAREAAGTSRDEIDAVDVSGVLTQAGARYGARFEELLPSCRVWVNGEPADPDTPVAATDEVAVLPPVSGG